MRALLVLLLSLATACASSGISVHATPPKRPLRLIAVGLADVRYEAQSFEIQRRSGDILDTLWTGSDFAVLGPTEFTVLNADERDPLRGTDILIRVKSLDVAPEEIAHLHTVITVREARGAAIVSGKASAVAGAYDATVVVNMTLVGLGGAQLAEVIVPKVLDPFGETPEADTRPGIRAAVKQATALLIERADPFIASGVPVELDTHPSASTITRAFRSDLDGGVALADDATSRAIEIWQAVQYFYPDAQVDPTIAQLRNPPGICPSVPVPPFRPGECIIAAGATPVTTPHTLRRLVTFGQTPKTLTVVGGTGVARELQFPLQP